MASLSLSPVYIFVADDDGYFLLDPLVHGNGRFILVLRLTPKIASMNDSSLFAQKKKAAEPTIAAVRV